jgi:diphthamide biosynthesis methyltransferase
MKWAVWDRSSARGPHDKLAPIGRQADREELELELVHWMPEKECRVVRLRVAKDGMVTVEHSTSESGDSGVDVEEIHRVTLMGWEE